MTYITRERKQPKVEQVLCETCGDKGFVRWLQNGVPTGEVGPCPDCNEDGMDEVTG